MRFLLPLLLLPFVAGCDSLGEASFTPQVSVESYQIVGEPLAPVYLSRTAAADQPLVPADAAVRDAVVTVTLVGTGGAPDVVVPYRLANATQGRYDAVQPPSGATSVRPLRTYRLSATIPGQSAPLTASTTTPGRFQVLSTSSLDVPYAPFSTQTVVSFNVSRPTFSGQSAAFVFASETKLPSPTLNDVVPFLRAILDGDGDGTPDFQEADADPDEPTFEDFRLGSSPVLNEANYATNADGTLTIDLPWIAVLFFGPLEVSVNALDDNLYDYLRSQAVQQGGTGISPGEVPNILTRVENGTGIFGSISKVSTDLNVRRP